MFLVHWIIPDPRVDISFKSHGIKIEILSVSPLYAPKMATILTFNHIGVRASVSGADNRTSGNTRRISIPSSSSPPANWWSPIFGWSSNPDYIDTSPNQIGEIRGESAAKPDEIVSKPARSRISRGCLTDFWFIAVIFLTDATRIYGRSHELEWQHQATWSLADAGRSSFRFFLVFTFLGLFSNLVFGRIWRSLGLPLTGKLDAETLGQIVSPICGISDGQIDLLLPMVVDLQVTMMMAMMKLVVSMSFSYF